jgi:AcrR family transcriptional regulator
MSAPRRYHHGDLRRAVLDAAIEVITADGPAALSLRELARRANVSHAAPAHHFKDRAGLLTALAIEGNDLLAAALAGGPAELDELGARYVRFALDHPAHFEVMYRPDLYHRDDPALVASMDRISRHLREAVNALPPDRRGADPNLAGLAAWSLVHGFAALLRGGNLDRMAAGAEPVALFRAMAPLLFAGPRGPAPS